MSKSMRLRILIMFLATQFFAFGSMASNLIFQGNNAAIFPGASPAGQPLLMESVVRPQNPALSTSANTVTSASLILQSVTSQISTRINNEIFNTSNPSGSFDLGGGNTINFVRTGGNIVININDTVRGSTTITIPDL